MCACVCLYKLSQKTTNFISWPSSFTPFPSTRIQTQTNTHTHLHSPRANGMSRVTLWLPLLSLLPRTIPELQVVASFSFLLLLMPLLNHNLFLFSLSIVIRNQSAPSTHFFFFFFSFFSCSVSFQFACSRHRGIQIQLNMALGSARLSACLPLSKMTQTAAHPHRSLNYPNRHFDGHHTLLFAGF